MNRIISWVKSIRLDRIIVVFLSGILLFVSTACNSSDVLAKATDKVSARTADQIREEVPENAVTNKYKGGMNDYSDVDPRQKTSGAQAKAKELIDKSEGNIQKSANNLEQYRENYQSGAPLGERVRQLGEDVGSSAKELTEGVTKGTQRGVGNLKANTQDAGEGVAEGAGRAASNVKENTKDAGQDLASKAKAAASQATSGVRRAADKAADAID